jgi:hypothetical protein
VALRPRLGSRPDRRQYRHGPRVRHKNTTRTTISLRRNKQTVTPLQPAVGGTSQGEMSDRVVDAAKATASDAVERGKEVAQEAAESAKERGKEQE